ncbi:CAF17-like 4Fe-4S cluster assembly/insertion protein YgfZ [Halomarina ordinaria]|uniref:Aminomethyltransferase family protein n=1 Tax=Halomarina ordinaria TaxID=3033939 RepID=A0ABD5U8H9_9EURY|nr:aminomethyltransferase family protein [Halomarina sp. PSRA2]
MTVIEDVHADHGATFTDHGGRRVVATYGRTDRTHRAVRNGVGVIELGYGILEVTGEDRVEFVDNAVSNRVPDDDGRGVYCLLCDPQGGIEADLYVYNAGERLLVFCPPDRASEVREDWAGKTFIQDVSVRVATDDLAVFGVHGPMATEKVASVLNHAGAPEPELAFVRGSMADVGVTVVASDASTGEEGYEVVCAADAAPEVFDTLLTRGMNAVPFGYETWNALTLEAGTPLYHTELRGRIPNVAGIRNALDFEKGCYVGQEVVSRVENVGRPSKRLVGLACDAVPEAGAAVFDGDAAVGEVTRGADAESYGGPAALAYVPFEFDGDPTVRVGGEERTARVVSLPFVEGSARSARLPTYPE